LPALEAYLARQRRLKEVPAALGVHPNTVKYRMHELRPYIESGSMMATAPPSCCSRPGSGICWI
jgi:hypothetical protein